MSDDKNNSPDNDRRQINAMEAHEIRYLSQKFNISPEQLTEAIMSTGTTNVAEIQAYLKRMEEK